MTQAFRKFQTLKRKVHAWNAKDFVRDNENNEKNAKIDTEVCVCQKCGFKAHYKFVRCPECEK